MKKILEKIIKRSSFFPTVKALLFDKEKFLARIRTKRMLKRYLRKNKSLPNQLHFGCGGRYLEGWLNIDIKNSDVDIDFSQGKLPFPSNYFNVALSQHVIEHLEMKPELIPIFSEFHRTLHDGGELWLSCPSIEKVCKSYLSDGAQSLIDGKKKRFSNYSTEGFPSAFVVNEIFYQKGEHKNLFDFELLRFLLQKVGFNQIEEVDEIQLVKRFGEFAFRNDAEQTIYVKETK